MTHRPLLTIAQRITALEDAWQRSRTETQDARLIARAKRIARQLAKRHPTTGTAERRAKKRRSPA